jgi:hypothetical protein
MSAGSNNIYAISAAKDQTFIAIGMSTATTTKQQLFSIVIPNTEYILNSVNGTRNYSYNYSSTVWAVRVSYDSNYVAVGTANGSFDIFSRSCPVCPIGYYQNKTLCLMCSDSM